LSDDEQTIYPASNATLRTNPVAVGPPTTATSCSQYKQKRVSDDEAKREFNKTLT